MWNFYLTFFFLLILRVEVFDGCGLAETQSERLQFGSLDSPDEPSQEQPKGDDGRKLSQEFPRFFSPLCLHQRRLEEKRDDACNFTTLFLFPRAPLVHSRCKPVNFFITSISTLIFICLPSTSSEREAGEGKRLHGVIYTQNFADTWGFPRTRVPRIKTRDWKWKYFGEPAPITAAIKGT